MLIGVPKEIKRHEYRVGIVPENIPELLAHGHRVLVESGAGHGIGAGDDVYRSAGAEIASSATQLFSQAGLIVKVKEPQAAERAMLRPGQILFTYLHLAPDPAQARDLIASGASCIAYETVTDDAGGLPLLTPMSAIAGRLATQVGAHFLEKANGGLGRLMGGIAGVAPADVVVVGGGIVGTHAIEVALGMGAEVWALDHKPEALERLRHRFGAGLHTVLSDQASITQYAMRADLLILGVLVAGATAPKLISQQLVKRMKPGAVIVDVAIDQGGCCETSHATTHDQPVYVVDDVLHYCVANMPGSVPQTSAYALNNATQPFILQLAQQGLDALRENPHLLNGLTVHRGHVTNAAVAAALGYDHVAPAEVLGHSAI